MEQKPPLKDTRLSDGLNLELTLPSDGAFRPTITVRATFPDKTPIEGNPESLACYDKHAYMVLGGLAVLGRVLLTFQAAPLTGLNSVPADALATYEKTLAKIAAEAVGGGLLDVMEGTHKDPGVVETIRTAREAGIPAIVILKTLGPVIGLGTHLGGAAL